NLPLERALDRPLTLTPPLPFSHIPVPNRDLARALTQALKRFLDRPLDKTTEIDWKETSDFLRRYIRFLTLANAVSMSTEKLSTRTRGKRFFFRRPSKPDEGYREQAIDAFLDLYIDFAILEERVQGEIQACEGILLVKERKQVLDQAIY